MEGYGTKADGLYFGGGDEREDVSLELFEEGLVTESVYVAHLGNSI